jgi:3-oxoacyl-[acyl-carrier-protein] synthase III
MGINLTAMYSSYGLSDTDDPLSKENTVFHLANKALKYLLKNEMIYSHLLTATSCPDSIAPSLGQCINQEYNATLGNCETIDIVQGCTGGVSALILASQLSEYNRSNVLVIASDAAQKATSTTSEVYKVFKNGVFGCSVSFAENGKKLIHHQSAQYKDLYQVVTIALGHDADKIISKNIGDIAEDSRKHLGLKLDNHMALRLMKHAEEFYLDFISRSSQPEILILHQVNEVLIDHLEKVFSKYPVRFINMAKTTGNCGCASTGIVLDHLKNEIENKKVMICSFGTGGVITAGIWQF